MAVHKAKTMTHQLSRSLPRFRFTEDGLQLCGSILWLDSGSCGQVTFVSSANMRKKFTSQIIATEETVHILRSLDQHPRALICQYNRGFSLGSLYLELLPSGDTLGGASLWIETAQGSALYCPRLRFDRQEYLRAVQSKPADTLVIGTPAPLLTGKRNQKKEKQRLLEFVENQLTKSGSATLLIENETLMIEVATLLGSKALPFDVHPAFYRLLKVHESYDILLGKFSRHHPSRQRSRILLYPFTQSPRLIKDSVLPPVALVQHSDQAFSIINTLQETFVLSQTPQAHELLTFISEVSPKSVSFFGPYSRSYAKALDSGAFITQELLYNSQPTLF